MFPYSSKKMQGDLICTEAIYFSHESNLLILCRDPFPPDTLVISRQNRRHDKEKQGEDTAAALRSNERDKQTFQRKAPRLIFDHGKCYNMNVSQLGVLGLNEV